MGAEVVIPWLFVAISATIILTWIWIKAEGNIFILAMAHASINSAQFFLENQLGQEEHQLILNSWEANGYVYLSIAVIFLFLMSHTFAKKTETRQ